MRFVYWITKASDTHLEYVILTAFTETMVIRTRLNVTVYVHCLSCLSFHISVLHSDWPFMSVNVFLYGYVEQSVGRVAQLV
jgi:hypothetical protein